MRSGYVSLVGRPNVGKSTLLNRLCSYELAITSPKAQTTRHLIRGVVDRPEGQIVFIDSPGIHRSAHKLDRSMAMSSRQAIEEADLIVLMIDARFQPRVDDIERAVCKQALKSETQLILAINKVDLIPKERLFPLIAAFCEFHPFVAVVPISATEDEGVDLLLGEIFRHLPEGEALMQEGEFTDQTESVLARELVRAEVLNQIHDEIPHGTAVEIESFDEIFDELSGERQRVRIEACIYCERQGHKGILLGKGGAQIRDIGTNARLRIAEMLGCPCDLSLFVKVRENWRNTDQILEELGYQTKPNKK